jgi:hypothetical protein
MSVTTQNTTINKSISDETAVNYDTMFKEAVDWVSEISGEKWTNYNPSDPGITILEFLCYGLLDLGYKSTFSMEDILSDSRDKIKTHNRLYTAREILFSNPVTINDFRKLIIDRAEGVKNVWIEKVKGTGSLPDTYETFYELSDQLKAKWMSVNAAFQPLNPIQAPITIYLDNPSNGKPPKLETITLTPKQAFKIEIGHITTGIDTLLSLHRNLGQIFFKPTVLIPETLTPSGTICLNKLSSVEDSLAQVYYALNNYISNYIQFYTYDQRIAAGESVGEILIGPRLENGFILDIDLLPRRRVIEISKLPPLLVGIAAVESVFSFDVTSDSTSEIVTPGMIRIKKRNAPFFDYQSVASLIAKPNSPLKIYSGDQQITKVDQTKINAYYQSLTARKAVSSYSFKDQLGPQISQGQFRNIKKYHSLQALFPASYGLQSDHSFDGYSKLKKAQIKQLKAYLMMFEQIIADHQAQMANLDELLSFHSEVKARKPLCKTYYAEGLYDAPGAEFILKAYDVYKKENGFISEYPYTTWNDFKADDWNLYEAFLGQDKTTEKNNIKRKDKLLSHVYARLGQEYDLEPLVELNPHYGNYDLARVEIVSELLKDFGLYGENLGRSYFSAKKSPIIDFETVFDLIPTPSLFSGLEFKFGPLFQLNGYYKGLVDVLSCYLTVNGDKSITANISSENIDGKPFTHQLVNHHKEPILKIPVEPLTYITSDEPIIQYRKVLQQMISQTKGFVLIDNQLLISNLQDENWGIKKNDKFLKLEKAPSQNNTGANAGVPIKHSNLRQVHSVLERFGDQWKDDKIEVVYRPKSVTDNEKPVTTPSDLFGANVAVFLLEGVCNINQPDFLNTFLCQFAKEGPIQLNYNLYMLSADEMTNLLDQRATWLKGNLRLQEGKIPEDGFIESINEIIQLLTVSKKQMWR